MKIQPVKGTRDFFPPVMAVRNFIIDGWKAASLRNGFEEYDGPIFEYLKMYQVKSGQEIAEQLFNFTDRGGRALAIRPEITPTLARMVNQQINSLSRPIKWFSVPRLCRAERPQRGRLREFFQWNVDIIGADGVRADAEVIFATLDYLGTVGLSADDVKAKISSRSLLAEFLKAVGIAADRLESVYPVLDKKDRVPPAAFEEMLATQVENKDAVGRIMEFMSLDDVGDVANLAAAGSHGDAGRLDAAVAELGELFGLLDCMGVADYCVFDPGIVRGLAYYTGPVFEVHDVVGDLRAVCGGGRYDNLLRDFGGPAVSATGMGMGDCVLEILLRQKGLLTDGQLSTRSLDYYVICLDQQHTTMALSLMSKLRLAGFAADMGYKSASMGKQLKAASAVNATKCVIIGSEFEERNKLVIKDMSSGEQSCVDFDQFLPEQR